MWDCRIDTRKMMGLRAPGDQWSGDSSRDQGFRVEESRVDVTIGDETNDGNAASIRKEAPIWMTESTILNPDALQVFFFPSLTSILFFNWTITIFKSLGQISIQVNTLGHPKVGRKKNDVQTNLQKSIRDRFWIFR